jgi:hypothetical protein
LSFVVECWDGEEVSDSQLLQAVMDEDDDDHDDEWQDSLSDSQLWQAGDDDGDDDALYFTPEEPRPKRPRPCSPQLALVGSPWSPPPDSPEGPTEYQVANPCLWDVGWTLDTPEDVTPLDELSYQELFDRLLASPQQQGGGPTSPPPSPPPPRPVANDEDRFEIVKVQEKTVKKFKTTKVEYSLKVHQRPREDVQEAAEAMVQVLDRILEHVKREQQVAPVDQLQVVIDGPGLDVPLALPFMPAHELTRTRLLMEILRVAQSKKEFLLNGESDVFVTHSRNVQGRGQCKPKRFDLRKQEEPEAWLKTLAARHEAVLCTSMQEAIAQALHFRRHGRVLPKRQDALKEATRRVQERVPEQGAESFESQLQRLNEMLQQDHRVRLVVLDWGQHDEPFFVGTGHDDDNVVVLYKMQAQFHLLLNPDKIQHAQHHLTLCKRCFFFLQQTQVCPCVRRTPTSGPAVPDAGTVPQPERAM